MDHLESLALLNTTVTYPTFVLGHFDGGSGPGGFTPAQLQIAYGFSSISFNGTAGTGSGEAIAIVDAYDDLNIQSDLNTVDSYFGLLATMVSRVNETGETTDDAYFEQAGVAFVASSGDSGAPASWPAASPNVLSVGGTALTLGGGNVWSSEVGWSGSGGGPSAYESQPSYQTGVVTQTSSARATPDVAYDASPSSDVAVYDSVPYEGETLDWVDVGGTSAGAPKWSALLAIADQGRALIGTTCARQH